MEIGPQATASSSFAFLSSCPLVLSSSRHDSSQRLPWSVSSIDTSYSFSMDRFSLACLGSRIRWHAMDRNRFQHGSPGKYAPGLGVSSQGLNMARHGLVSVYRGWNRIAWSSGLCVCRTGLAGNRHRLAWEFLKGLDMAYHGSWNIVFSSGIGTDWHTWVLHFGGSA